MMRWELRVTLEETQDLLRIAAHGRLSAATAPRLVEALVAAIEGGKRRILLDLNELDYISSAGILAIQAAGARVEAGGGTLTVENAQPAVRVALDLAGIQAPA
jgi:anti-sigma B factor antagonist